jgi:NTP pyrophosphatase (non-canonical NTP hydrolase)
MRCGGCGQVHDVTKDCPVAEYSAATWPGDAPPPKMTPYEASRAVFNDYAGMGGNKLPTQELSALQVALCRWQNENFGYQPAHRFVLGFIEEVGEARDAFDALHQVSKKLAHVQLKHEQGIRGYADVEKYRAEMADGIADAFVFLTQLATLIRCDIHTLVQRTAESVMTRNWKQNKQDGT